MKKKYLIPGAIVALILLVVFFFKNIFPFGDDFIAWGDMHSQILALYYNFYDIFYNGKSFLIDFTSGTASNIISNFSYYIVSPFTFIVLLFERVNIPQAVSLIVMLKIVVSAVTCNWFLDKYFTKLNNFYKIFFSILYALSTYSLSLYIITGWIDVMYMFPLILIGLGKLLNEEKSLMLIITLSLSLLFNFYISLMCIIFIFFVILIYFIFFKIDRRKEKITLVGISVFLSLMISSILLLPTALQILSSARMGFNFTELLTAKTGPIVDKFMFLTSTAAMISCNVLMLKNYKKDKKHIMFFIVLLFLVGISLVIEPINKMWHFGSYVSYPYRYGFILVILLIISSCFYLSKRQEPKKEYPVLLYIVTLICNILIIIVSYRYYVILQQGVDELSFSFNRFAFLIMVILSFLNFIPYLIIFIFGNKDNKHTKICLMINLILFCLIQSSIYIKIDYDEKRLHSSYDDMNYIYNLDLEDNYYLKQENINFIQNSGFVVGKPSRDFFTSLTDNNMFLINQKLGYNSHWMSTASRGGNYFLDFLLGNKYLVTDDSINNELYKLKNQKEGLFIYEATLPVSKGQIIKKNKSIINTNNSFDATNVIYSAVTGKDEYIFDIIDEFKCTNLNFNNNYIDIIDEEADAYFETTVVINNKKTVYLEILKSYLNMEQIEAYKTFDVYVNDKLIIENYFNEESNSNINLGTFENETIKIKIIVKKDIKISSIKIGVLDYEKLTSYFKENNNDIDVEYQKNKIKINYIAQEENILFIPTAYLEGMRATNNNEIVQIEKVFDNFLGIRVSPGENNIVVSYITPGLRLGTIISILGIILTVVFIKLKSKILSLKVINNIFYYSYLVIYSILSLVVYVFPFVIFLLSYF